MTNSRFHAMISGVYLMAWAIGAYEPPLTTVTFRVLDEGGRPISNAWVRGTGYWRPAKREGVTDIDGYFRYEDRVVGDIGCRAGQTGYYDTRGEMWPGPRKLNDHPTNALVVVLKKKINPVSMISKRISTHLPRVSVPVAFDLEVGDWVSPDGKGKQNDVWVTSQKRMANRNDFELNVTVCFTNGLDGIQEFWALSPYEIPLASELMPPQEAPRDGYIKSIEASKVKLPGHPYFESWRKNRNYIFRIRTVTNDTGGIVEANYGWIMKDFVIGPDEGKTTLLMFNYFYNPDPHSRSLESTEAP